MQPLQQFAKRMKVGKERRAIVIGGSISGLLAARILSDFYDEVIVYERNRYPDIARPRGGVPQGYHVHLLLIRGIRILDDLFPGLIAEMEAAGAPVVNPGNELCVLTYWGWRLQYDSQIDMLTFTRPFLDWHLLRRLRSRPNVILVEGTQVNGLLANGPAGQVTGVEITRRGGSGDIRAVEANLIVTANGRFGRLPAWLSELGYDRPAATEVDPQIGYTSAVPGQMEVERASAAGRSTAHDPRWRDSTCRGRPLAGDDSRHLRRLSAN